MRRPIRHPGPLRVLFVGPGLLTGGAERHLVTLLTSMDRSRFDPSVVCISAEVPLFAELAAAGIPTRSLGRTRYGTFLAFLDLVRHFRRTRPDIVVVQGVNASILGRLAAAVCGVPRSVVWVHNCCDLGPPRRLPQLTDRLLDPVTSAYFGVAAGQVRYLTEGLGYPASKVRIVRNGTDLTRFRFSPLPPRNPHLAGELGVQPGEPVVGIVGVMRPEKDHPTFLHAARLVLDRVPRARFLLVGPPPGELGRLAEELGIAERVTFTGERSDVPQLLSMFDVFALTSYAECFPMAVLEAMAVGRPTVCTSVGGVPEIVDDGVTGYLVPPRDPVALAERLVALLEDPERAAEMGRAARARVEAEFTIEHSVRNAERALEETAAGGAPAEPRAARA